MEAIIRVKGGLGNQLWQLQFGRFLFNKYGVKVSFDCLSGFINDNFSRSCEIEKFIINKNYSHRGTRTFTLNFVRFIKYFSKFKIHKVIPINWNYIEENQLINLNELFSRNKQERIILDGYWQNNNYFNDSLYNEFIEFISGHRVELIDKSAVHYRCLRFDKVPPQEYFKDSLIALKNTNMSIQDVDLYSDDYLKAKELAKYLELELNININCILDDISPTVLLIRLSSYKGLVASNGTLSFWASSYEKNKRVIFSPRL